MKKKKKGIPGTAGTNMCKGPEVGGSRKEARLENREWLDHTGPEGSWTGLSLLQDYQEGIKELERKWGDGTYCLATMTKCHTHSPHLSPLNIIPIPALQLASNRWALAHPCFPAPRSDSWEPLLLRYLLWSPSWGPCVSTCGDSKRSCTPPRMGAVCSGSA